MTKKTRSLTVLQFLSNCFEMTAIESWHEAFLLIRHKYENKLSPHE